MAKSTRKGGNISPIRNQTTDEGGTATAVMEPDTPFDQSPPPEPEAHLEPPRRGRPPVNKTQVPRAITFFQRLGAIAPEDWGTRAKVRVYRLAPIIDRLRGSDTKFICMYEEIVNEERIKHDWGSGRYRLYLNFKLPQQGEKELDSVEIDIMDMKYPPNVPPGEWVEDPRNKQWAWAKGTFPAAAPAAAAPGPAVSDPLAAFDTFMSIQDRVQERMTPAAVAAPPAPPAPADPFDTAKKIMDMRTNDPMISLLLARMEAQDKAAESARQREYDLQKELRQSQTVQQQAAAPKSLVEQMEELAKIKGTIQTLFGGGAAAEGTVRPGKFGWLDFAREVVPEVMNSKILNALADKMTTSPITTVYPINPATAPNGNGNGAKPEDLLSFVQHVITPPLLEYFRTETDGTAFATWVYDGFPDRLAEIQAIGEQRIFELYKSHAPREDWAMLTSRGEQAFAVFVHEFCAFKPPAEEEEDEKPGAAASGIIDLDVEESEVVEV